MPALTCVVTVGGVVVHVVVSVAGGFVVKCSLVSAFSFFKNIFLLISKLVVLEKMTEQTSLLLFFCGGRRDSFDNGFWLVFLFQILFFSFCSFSFILHSRIDAL